MITLIDNIINKQNSKINIKRLRAQRTLYSSAKKLIVFQLFLSIPCVILLSFVVLILSKGWLTNILNTGYFVNLQNNGWFVNLINLKPLDIAWVMASYGVSLTILDVIFFNQIIESKKDKAARIQQLFDCDVLSLNWNDIAYGRIVQQEDIEKWSNKGLKKHSQSELSDWYSKSVDALPLEVGRFICQSINCWWDTEVRRSYNKVVYIVGIALLFILFIIASANNLSLQNFLSLVVSPMLPFVIFSQKAISDNYNAINRLIVIKEAQDQMWSRILTKNITLNELENISHTVQLGIFNNRKHNPLIFDWIYKLSKNKNENIMNQSAEEYLEQYTMA